MIQTISVHILPPCGDLNATLMRIQVILMSQNSKSANLVVCCFPKSYLHSKHNESV